MSLVVTPEDLGLFMNNSAIDPDRAQLFLDLAGDLAASIVDPVPDGAKAVILTAAARAMPNPSGAASQAVPGSSTDWSSARSATASSGLYLSRSERLALRRMAGLGGGAFSVNVAPDAGRRYRDALRFATDRIERFTLDEDLP